MKRITLKFIPGVFLAVIFLLSSCTSAYKVTKSEGTMVAIDSTWDVNPDAEAVALLAPYKAKVDSIMYRVVGTAEMSMDKGAPEGEVKRQGRTLAVKAKEDKGIDVRFK